MLPFNEQIRRSNHFILLLSAETRALLPADKKRESVIMFHFPTGFGLREKRTSSSLSLSLPHTFSLNIMTASTAGADPVINIYNNDKKVIFCFANLSDFPNRFGCHIPYPHLMSQIRLHTPSAKGSSTFGFLSDGNVRWTRIRLFEMKSHHE